jgi:hypothetical protein
VGHRAGHASDSWLGSGQLGKIASAWGNDIRNKVTHVFANKAERNAQAVPQNGMRCVTLDTQIEYIRLGGAWHVEEMPWRNFTPLGWCAPTVSPSTLASLGMISVQYARWRQRRGQAEIKALFVGDTLTVTNIDAYIFGWTPIPAVNTTQLGHGRLYVFVTGLSHGGNCRWWDHVSGGSRFIYENVGAGVTPNSIVRTTGSNGTVEVAMNLTYECDATVDTP